MIKLAVKDECDGADSKENYIGNDCGGVELELVTHGRLGVESMELIDATSSDSRGSSRVSARAITGSNDVALLQVESAHLRLVDGSAVVATRSRSGKGLDLSLLSLSIMGNDAHGVTSLDFFNILPADHMAGEWVDYLDPFVIKDNSWNKKELVEDRRGKDAPSARNHSACESVIEEIYVSQGAKEKEAQKGKNIGARRSEELAIGHDDIFSRATEMRAA